MKIIINRVKTKIWQDLIPDFLAGVLILSREQNNGGGASLGELAATERVTRSTAGTGTSWPLSGLFEGKGERNYRNDNSKE